MNTSIENIVCVHRVTKKKLFEQLTLAAACSAFFSLVVLSLVKNNIDLDVEKGASYTKQKPEKSREILRG